MERGMLSLLARIPRSKSRIALIVIVIVVIVFQFSGKGLENEYLPAEFRTSPAPTEGVIEKPIVGQFKPKVSQEFWAKIFAIMEESKPEVPIDCIKYVDKSEQIQGPKNKQVLLSKAEISPENLTEFKLKHDKIMKQLPEKISTSTFKKGSRGVVLVGGGRYSWLSYLSIVSLRDTGSRIPVEVFMPTFKDFEREKEFCNVILPELQASCVVVPDALGADVMLKWSPRISSYQYKSLALMTSSFENVLLLDSDNIILSNPDEVFDSQLYKDNGMITWPDYWQRTISPHFYDIANVKINEKKRVRYNRYPLKIDEKADSNIAEDDEAEIPFHDLEGTIPDLSTESGQLIINKATHGKTLLLSLYYNIYGPKLFYKLFSLGEQGEGDKDTFVAAATVCKDKFYQVKSYIQTFGYVNSEGKFQGVAMGQKHPLVDFKAYEDNIVKSSKTNNDKGLKEQIETLKNVDKEIFDQRNGMKLFTIHCNYPKLDPLDLMTKMDIYDSTKNVLKYKLFGTLKYEKNIIANGQRTTAKTAFELERWTQINRALCERNLKFVHFAKTDMKEICNFIENQVKFLKET